jgi:S-adenosylmethionine:tRNA ribosyltransferase-isomerase
MRTGDLDYALPEELIAKVPLAERDASRLLVLDAGGTVEHRSIRELPGLVKPALFVLNDTKVLPARLRTTKASGGKVELLLVEKLGVGDLGEGDRPAEERWLAMGRASKGLPAGLTLEFGAGVLRARIDGPAEDGLLAVTLSAPGGVENALATVGELPLPPYLARLPEPSDSERYQTVFARVTGSVAAPTAGLHFSDALMAALTRAGHRFAHVTLHVGPGTFAPIRGDDLDAHVMHSERYEIPEATRDAIAAARTEGRPIIAVGTTVVRTLESAKAPGRTVHAGEGRTAIFIKPPYSFGVVDGLVTNFHLPRSTLLALVMALRSRESVLGAYGEAVAARYRFFSYGDAMFLPPSDAEGRTP